MYTCITTPWTSLPPSPSHPSRSSQSTKLNSCALQQVPTSCFIHGGVYVNPSLPIHPTPCFPPSMSTSPFSTSASLALPCKQVYPYHFSRFHICINRQYCFSLSDLLQTDPRSNHDSKSDPILCFTSIRDLNRLDFCFDQNVHILAY